MRRVNLMVLLALMSAFVLPLALPTPAYATLEGPDCSVSATIPGYETIDPRAKTGVYAVPINGSAHYVGGIANLEVPDEGRAVSGSVSVALPLGGSVNIKSWDDPDSTEVGDEGDVTWDLPGFTPRGIEMTVSGSHSDLTPCSGSISVKLEGGLLDSATGIVTAVMTVVTGLFALAMGIPTKQ